MSDDRVRITSVLRPVFLAVLSVLIVYLVLDFGRELALSQRQHRALQRMEQRVQSAQERNDSLTALLEFSQSSQAAEAWAREQGWVKPNEQAVVIYAPQPEVRLAESAGPSGSAVQPPPWQSWLELFFGQK